MGAPLLGQLLEREFVITPGAAEGMMEESTH
jgi:hypothetical protein